MAVFFALISIFGATSWAVEPGEEKPPELSLESLYHPDKKHDHDGKLPSTHWIAGEPPTLLVRRKKAWLQVDLESGAEKPWPTFGRLVQQLGKLNGLAEKKATSAAFDAVSKLKQSSDTVLLKIDKSLAVVSADAPARWLTRDAATWKNAALDPTARRVAYTSADDLFLVDVASGKTLRLTNDGTDTMLDGILDWMYQEEIFGRGNYRGFWFSPNGDWLAMMRIDISAVEPYFLSSTRNDRGSGLVRRYPKAGDPIPQAALWVWDLRNIDQAQVPPPKLVVQSTPHEQRVITGVWWHENLGTLMYCVSDRKQTWRELRFVGEPFLLSAHNESSLLLREESPAWVELPASPGMLADGSLVWRSELPTGRNRLYHLTANGSVMTPLSPEDFDVDQFYVRPDASFAVVTGNADGGIGEKHVYRMQLRNNGSPAMLERITSEPGWHQISISPDGEHLLDTYSTLSEPPRLSVRRSLPNSKEIVIEQSVLDLQQEMVAPEAFHIPTEDGVQLPAILVRPPGSTADNKAAVVVEVYGGPQNPSVANRWLGTKSLYRELLARRGIATLIVDNRSSAGRSVADTWTIRGRVGEVEFQDVQAAVGWLKGQDWVDSDRLAIRGWSFGGFLTLYTMTHCEDFTAGIAGGSVTDWREYDAFYTERYMGLPSENQQAYKSTAPIESAEKMHGRVLMIHGEMDDNVHPAGTMRMVDALQKAGKDFELMIYPGAAHAIHEPRQVWHLAKLTDRFLIDALGRQGSKTD